MISFVKQQKLNLLTGWIFLIALAVFIASTAGLVSFNEIQPTGRKYVAVVGNGGGVTEGTPIFMKGMRVGEVVRADLIQDDGKPQVRIEVELNVRDKEGEYVDIPSNSRFVVSAPGLGSTPTVSIVWGDSKDDLQTGEEFAITTPANDEGGLAGITAAVKDLGDSVDSKLEQLDRENTIEEALIAFEEIRIALGDFESNIAGAADVMNNLGEDIPTTSAGVKDLQVEVQTQTRSLRDKLQSMQESASDIDEDAQTVADQIEQLNTTVSDWANATDTAAGKTQAPALREFLKNLRWQSAQLAAWGDTLKRDPSNLSGGERQRERTNKFNAGNSPLGRFGGGSKLKETE
ncbi:MlaD family protein [Planctomycetota bacterium]|nr:MlaD family protein [Planctomycetota bacterium]